MKKKSKLILSRKGKITNDKRYICEVVRQIYDVAFISLQDDPEALNEMIELLEEVLVMGVRMSKKLIENKMSQDEIVLQKTTDHEKVKRIRRERVRLEKLLMENGKVLKKAKDEGII